MSEGDSSRTVEVRTGRGLTLVGAVAVALLGAITIALYAAGVEEFFFWSDDAFISYRYSRHFVEAPRLHTS